MGNQSQPSQDRRGKDQPVSPETNRLRFRRAQRLRLRRDVDRVFSAKCSAGDDLLIVYVAANELGWSRLAVSVSKRLGNAVRRNRLRRLVREAYRTTQHELPSGFDVLVIVKKGVRRSGKEATLAPIKQSLSSVMRRAVQRWLKRASQNDPSDRSAN